MKDLWAEREMRDKIDNPYVEESIIEITGFPSIQELLDKLYQLEMDGEFEDYYDVFKFSVHLKLV